MSDRAKITAGELVIVLSHYDLGAIHTLERHKGGSRQTPKVLINSSAGQYLLKRHVSVAGDSHGAIARVRRSHSVHARLHSAGVPVPALVRTREGESYLHMPPTSGPAQGVYEVYVFIPGARYQHVPAQAHAAGALLRQFHSATDGLVLEVATPSAGYHARAEMPATFDAARDRLSDPRARPVLRSLWATYQQASERAEAIGVGRSPVGVVHADWHPGNLIFRSPHSTGPDILALIDLDSVRLGPRVLDLANGAMQLAIHRVIGRRPGVGAEAGTVPSVDRPWRIVLIPELLAAFCAGFRSQLVSTFGGGNSPVTTQIPDELWPALPWLMCEALIVEAVYPIAQTGSFGKLDPLAFLALIDTTTRAIAAQHARLVSICLGQ